MGHRQLLKALIRALLQHNSYMLEGFSRLVREEVGSDGVLVVAVHLFFLFFVRCFIHDNQILFILFMICSALLLNVAQLGRLFAGVHNIV